MCVEINLEPIDRFVINRHMTKYTREYLLDQLKESFQRVGQLPNSKKFHIHENVYRTRFGSWSKALREAGLPVKDTNSITGRLKASSHEFVCPECNVKFILSNVQLCSRKVDIKRSKQKGRRGNTFCSQSCAAKYNNIRRVRNRWKKVTVVTKTPWITIKIPRKPKPKLLYCRVYFGECKGCKIMFSAEMKRQKKKYCSDKCVRKKLSDTAKNNPKMGGNKNTRAFGWYVSPSAGRVWLESSYEAKVAESLDSNKIVWSRPHGLKYILNEKQQTYYADFFLRDDNVYLDPKNSFLIEKDKDKIQAVRIQQNVRILILTKDELDWTNIQQLIKNGAG